MTAELIKLPNAGDTRTLKVSSCVPLTMGKYPDVEFTGIDTNGKAIALRVPKGSADRQLGRLTLDYAATVGKTLRFSRDPNTSDASKPYWGISVSDAMVPTNGTNGNASKVKQGIDIGPHIPGLDDDPPPPDDAASDETTVDSPKAKLQRLFKLQEVCFTHALKLATLAEQNGVTPTLEGVSALTAQALIAATNRGIGA